MKKTPFLCAVVLTLAATASTVICQQIAAGTKPAKTNVPESGDAYCSSLPSRIRVCRVTQAGSGDAKYIVQVDQKTTTSFVAPAWTVPGGPPDGFYTYQGDLDGDGSHELVVVTQDGAGNGALSGMASTAYFLADPTKGTNAAPVSVPIMEFGPDDSFEFDKSLNRTLVLVTYWDNFTTLDPKRGYGTYLVGKWFTYEQGKLKPVLTRPTLARRLLNSFVNVRHSDQEKSPTPSRWLMDPSTHHYFREPRHSGKLVSVQDGVLGAASTKPTDEGCGVEIKTSNGQTERLRCYDGVPSDRNDNREWITRFGLWDHRYLFPVDFDPAQTLGPLEGKRVKLENYIDEYGLKSSVLWFVEE